MTMQSDLAELEREFAEADGRGVDLAERIDALSANIDNCASALAALTEEDDSLVDPEWTDQQLAPFGVTLADLGIAPADVQEMARHQRITPTEPGLVVSIERVSVALARRLVPSFEDPGHPYHGAGRNARHRTHTACAAIAAHLGLPYTAPEEG